MHRGSNVKSQNTFSILNFSSHCSGTLCMKTAGCPRNTFAVLSFSVFAHTRGHMGDVPSQPNALNVSQGSHVTA